MKQLTIRNVSTALGKRLDELSHRTGKSVNTLVLELLDQALGVNGRRERLKAYVTWTEEEGREFDEHLEAQRKVDRSLWR
jgi:plasmid stability protein